MILDRVWQARVLNALEPEWEARFEPKSYGFRPGRGCHDAIEAIFNTVNGPNPARRWVLDADLAAAFDRLSHDHILAMVGDFPAKEFIAGWLRAGVVHKGQFTPTEEGVPQGGISLRTLGRRIAGLLKTLDARTRFQAGLQASQQGAGRLAP